MGRHSEFATFEAFCADFPADGTTVRALHRVSDDRLDEYVSATTEFANWEEMKRTAAVEDIVDHVVA